MRPRVDEAVGAPVLGRLSSDALRHGARLALVDPAAVPGALYRYNTIPGGAITDGEAVVESVVTQSTRRRWIEASFHPTARDGWIGFAPSSRLTSSGYKLYVSPHTDDVPGALDALFAIMATTHAPVSFKVASGDGALARPDKVVLYFSTAPELRSFATQVGRRLAVRAQGVPFSAQLDRTGVLSWGTDRGVAQFLTGPASSWRGELCGRLASALVGASGTTADRVVAARRAATSLGIDPRGWTCMEATA